MRRRLAGDRHLWRTAADRAHRHRRQSVLDDHQLDDLDYVDDLGRYRLELGSGISGRRRRVISGRLGVERRLLQRLQRIVRLERLFRVERRDRWRRGTTQ
jgi:hypothetical protein